MRLLSTRPLKITAAIMLTALLGGCSSYHYKDYQGDWAPEQMTPFDLSDNAPDAPVVYFATVRYRDLGVPFHRLLLATHVDDQLLEGAGRASILNVSGKQALKLTPGKHSLRWCWTSMNALGTGGAQCNQEARDVEFKAGRRYIVDFRNSTSIVGAPGRESMRIHIKSTIRDLDSEEVVYPVFGSGQELIPST